MVMKNIFSPLDMNNPGMPAVIGNKIICLVIRFNITDPFTVFRLQDNESISPGRLATLIFSTGDLVRGQHIFQRLFVRSSQ